MEQLKDKSITEVDSILVSNQYSIMVITHIENFVSLTSTADYFFKFSGKKENSYYTFVGDFCFIYVERKCRK